MYQPSYDDDEEPYRSKQFNPPKIPDKESMEAIDGLQEGSTSKKKSKKLEEGGKEEEEGSQIEEEDSLAMLAKKMGRAGKYFWRKMSIGGKSGKSDAGEDNKNRKVEPVLAPVKSPRLSGEKHQGVEESLGSVCMGEIAEQYSKSQETSSVYIEDTPHEVSFIPPPPSNSQCLNDHTLPTTLQPSSQDDT